MNKITFNQEPKGVNLINKSKLKKTHKNRKNRKATRKNRKATRKNRK